MSPKIYAQALARVLTKKPSAAEEKKIITNLLIAVRRRGDTKQLPKIIAATEGILRTRDGRRKVEVQTARPIPSLKQRFHKLIRPSDVVQEKINPELVAGMRIIINDELQFDGSLRRKLGKLFRET
ncbi:MAG: F0F1 ATP synthase subunit delta [Patescibacteria group bacterium]